jgi:DNA-3-methyladenine glycosylase I
MKRCSWVTKDQIYLDYHDKEWAVPVHDDNKLFEYLILEGAQAGLSWLTVLKKRDNYRKLYDNFDPRIIANYDENKKQQLMENPGIIRNRLKIEASILNAKAFLKLQEEFGSFKNYIWAFVDNKPIKNSFKELKDLPSSTAISDKISKDLKDRSFKFIGSTIIYSFMQAIGMVNDHSIDCFRYNLISNQQD